MHTDVLRNNDLSAWIGRSETVEDVASRSASAGLAAVLDASPSSAAVDGAELFPLGHWLHFTNTTPTRELGVDGHPVLGDFMPPLDLPRRMWAGSAIAFHTPITVGQRLTRTTTIESITPKTGSNGRLCFVVLRHEVRADGTIAVVDRQTIVYRESAPLGQATASAHLAPRADSPAPGGWDWVQARRSNEVTLFRYSALIFVAHRIHYDLPYATGVEGYPGLVVHGPLSATYLVDGFLRTHPGAILEGFEFSARAPIFANEQVHIAGREIEEGVEQLAVIGPDGESAITATIRYR